MKKEVKYFLIVNLLIIVSTHVFSQNLPINSYLVGQVNGTNSSIYGKLTFKGSNIYYNASKNRYYYNGNNLMWYCEKKEDDTFLSARWGVELFFDGIEKVDFDYTFGYKNNKTITGTYKASNNSNIDWDMYLFRYARAQKYHEDHGIIYCDITAPTGTIDYDTSNSIFFKNDSEIEVYNTINVKIKVLNPIDSRSGYSPSLSKWVGTLISPTNSLTNIDYFGDNTNARSFTAEGKYNLKYILTDELLNTRDSNTLEFYIDRSGPKDVNSNAMEIEKVDENIKWTWNLVDDDCTLVKKYQIKIIGEDTILPEANPDKYFTVLSPTNITLTDNQARTLTKKSYNTSLYKYRFDENDLKYIYHFYIKAYDQFDHVNTEVTKSLTQSQLNITAVDISTVNIIKEFTLNGGSPVYSNLKYNNFPGGLNTSNFPVGDSQTNIPYYYLHLKFNKNKDYFLKMDSLKITNSIKASEQLVFSPEDQDYNDFFSMNGVWKPINADNGNVAYWREIGETVECVIQLKGREYAHNSGITLYLNSTYDETGTESSSNTINTSFANIPEIFTIYPADSTGNEITLITTSDLTSVPVNTSMISTNGAGTIFNINSLSLGNTVDIENDQLSLS